MTRAASRALASAALTALLAPALPPLGALERGASGTGWAPFALLAAVAFGALPALLSALWIAELAPRPLARAAGHAYDAAAAVPSFAWAWLLGVFVAPRCGPAVAAGAFFAAVAAPTTALAALDALGRTPVALREASLALGASPWQVAWGAVVPAARRELVAAALLGVGRALAESLVLVALGGRPGGGYAWLLVAGALALAASRYFAPEEAA